MRLFADCICTVVSMVFGGVNNYMGMLYVMNWEIILTVLKGSLYEIESIGYVSNSYKLITPLHMYMVVDICFPMFI